MGPLAPSSRSQSLRPAALLAAATAATLLVSVAPPAAGDSGSPALLGGSWTRAALDPSLPVTGEDLQRVVVSGVSGALGAVRDAVEGVGGTVHRALPLVDGVAATVPAERLPDLSRESAVRAITADRRAKLYGSSWDESVSASSYAWNAGAPAAWSDGARGAGVGVAVLDTGVAPVGDLADRLVHGPDLSGEDSHTADSFGHGTVMAGIVAGSGADGGAAPRTGVAPGAHVVSVKVAGRNGATDVSTVLAGMNWVASFADEYDIRVLNLSWGVVSAQHPSVDPLNHAVQRLTNEHGITVVVAAGNSGPEAGTITKPADDPLVLTVGAYDDRGDLNPANDVVPKWSSQGPTAAGLAKPDLVAPGRTLIATRAPGSTVEAENPKALEGASYIKGSGTSEAAAVASGAAAILLGANPTWTPAQVKAALTGTSEPIAKATATAQGAGRLRLDEAMSADVDAVTPEPTTAIGTGTLEGSRGSSPRVVVTCEGTEKVLDDETTSWCGAWDGNSWTGNSWTGNSWTGNSWTGNSWTGNSWTGNSWTDAGWNADSWTGKSWTGNSWTGNSWTGNSWTGNSWTGMAFAGNSWTGKSWTGKSWTGKSWTGNSWTGKSWTGNSWTGNSWTGNSWTGNSWTGNSWTGNSWTSAFWGAQPPAHVSLPGEVSEVAVEVAADEQCAPSRCPR